MKTTGTTISCNPSTQDQNQHRNEASKSPGSKCTCSTRLDQQIGNPSDNRFKLYIGRVFSFCIICCAAPYALVALGVMSVSTGAYFGRVVEVSLTFSAFTAVAYFLWRHFKKG